MLVCASRLVSLEQRICISAVFSSDKLGLIAILQKVKVAMGILGYRGVVSRNVSPSRVAATISHVSLASVVTLVGLREFQLPRSGLL